MNALELNIMDALAGNPRVHPDEISVQALDGDVTLRGTVGSVVQREEAMRTTRHVSGVTSVTDRLRLGLLDASRRADADTEAAVLDALNADTAARASGVDVDVRDGAVTLSGLVELDSQRDRAERDALAVPGVASVHNRLRVVFPSRPTTWPSASPTRSASARSSDGRDRRSAARVSATVTWPDDDRPAIRTPRRRGTRAAGAGSASPIPRRPDDTRSA
jgi:osmotically-inducible protein OsmY